MEMLLAGHRCLLQPPYIKAFIVRSQLSTLIAAQSVRDGNYVLVFSSSMKYPRSVRLDVVISRFNFGWFYDIPHKIVITAAGWNSSGH